MKNYLPYRENYYKEIHPTPEEFGQAFKETLDSNTQQNPQNMANTLLKIIETPVKDREFRYVVDDLGMGAAIRPYNQAHEEITKGVYTAFGIDHLLNVK